VLFVHEHILAALDHIVAADSSVADNSAAVGEGRRMSIVAEDMEAAEEVAGHIGAAGKVAVVMHQVSEVVEGIVEGCMGWLGEPRDMEIATGRGTGVVLAAQPARTSRTCS
jgi:hypothetical protein